MCTINNKVDLLLATKVRQNKNKISTYFKSLPNFYHSSAATHLGLLNKLESGAALNSDTLYTTGNPINVGRLAGGRAMT